MPEDKAPRLDRGALSSGFCGAARGGPGGRGLSSSRSALSSGFCGAARGGPGGRDLSSSRGA
eukprot:7902524-Alexandrium_andersonii.AAC.1